MDGVDVRDLLLHPVRMRILLCIAGHELTSREIAASLSDVAHATLYRQIARLHEAGILTIVEETRKRGGIERRYAMSTPYLDVSRSFLESGKDEQLQFFLVFVASLLQDFALYLDRRTTNPIDDFGFQSLLVNLSDDEFKSLTKKLNALMKPYLAMEPRKGRRPRSLTTILIPKDAE